MHPDNSFRSGDRALHETVIDEVGFGMIFAQTPDGPRVAHTPLVSTGDGAVQFHLSRGNALTRHLTDCRPLIVVNGPDAYVSARWYDDPDQVPTWNYLALELEGPVRQMKREGLIALLEQLVARHEGRIEGGEPWTMDKLTDRHRDALLKGIVGFEMEVVAWRDTAKLSQNKPPEVRRKLAEKLSAQGARAMAELMRSPVAEGDV